MNPLFFIIPLILLLGGSSTAALREKKQLATAHSETQSLQATVASLKSSESEQVKAQEKEDADRKSKQIDIDRQAQIRGTYHVATAAALKQTPPAVDTAILTNSLAMGADDPVSPTSQTQGLAIAEARAAQQAQLIADLQAQLKEVKDDNAVKTLAIASDVKEKISATQQIGSLTGAVDVVTNKLVNATAAKQDLLAQIGALSAKYGQLVFWCAVISGIVFVLFHIGLFRHVAVVKQLGAVTAAHTVAVATIATQQATIDAHVATIKTLATTP